MSAVFNPARRQLLRGNIARKPMPQRPPWSLAEMQFITACTRCNHCLSACPEGILLQGDGGYPELDFRRGECTFCGACVKACEPQALGPMTATPWQLQLTISDQCVAKRQVVCRSCGEACDSQAIRFTPRLNQTAAPEVDVDACTGCGACVSVCPVAAITLNPLHQEA